jgi:serine/threonine protein kinase
MNQSVAPSADVVFRDALGERRRMVDSTGHEAELLCISAELTSVPAFEPALTRTVNRLIDFRHPSFQKVRHIERFEPGTPTIVSDAVHGVRLSRLLTSIAERGIALEVGAVICITRQILTAVDAFHAYDRDLSHGALGPERVIINSNAKVIVADYMLGPALEQMRYSHQHYWKSLRVGLPRSAGATKFDHSVDVLQIGSITLALLLGRLLKDDEYSAKLVDVINSTLAPGGTGEFVAHKPELRDWLLRSIQSDPNHSFSSASEAGAALDSMQSEEERAAGMASLERVLMRHHGVTPSSVAVKPAMTVPVVEPLATPVVKPPVVSMPVEPPAPVVFKPVAAPAPVEPPPTTYVFKPPVAHAPLEPAAPPFMKPMTTPPPAESSVLLPLAASIESHGPSPVAAAAAMNTSRSARQQPPRGWQHVAAAVVAILALTAGGLYAVRRGAFAGGAAVAEGTLTVQSNPSGARIEIDGKASGFTPATLTVQQGNHTIVLYAGGAPKTMTVSVPAGAQVSQYIEFARTVPTTGGLLVRTDPPGALVSVDSVKRGASPATIAELAPGEHTVVVSSDGISVEQIVNVEAGVTASLVVPLVARDRMSGWIAVTAPIDVQIYEDGKLLGTNQTDKVMVSAGEHRVDFINEALGFRVNRKLTVAPGKVDNVSLKLPTGSISLNAVPWAEVWIDGEKAGDTPIGNLQTTIGKHDVVFRHPELGETRQSVTVTLLGPARLSVDMRKK